MEDNDEIVGLIRSANYMKELYDIKEEVVFSSNITKLYAHTKDKELSLVISKINCVILSHDNMDLIERIVKTVKLIEENLILVDNLWLEKIPNKSHKFYLYIAEYTKSSYRKEFGVINFSYYNNESKGMDIDCSIALLKSLFEKLRIIHQEKCISHLNLASSNIYINKQNNEVFFGPCKLGNYEENSIWYVAPEYFYVPNSYKELDNGIKNDIWSIGCIIAELFFLPCPLFQAFSPRETMKKIVETLGVPSYESVSYMSKQEYNILLSADNNKKKTKPSIYILIEDQDKENQGDETNENIYMFKKKIFEMMLKCFNFKRSKRITIDDLLDRLKEAEDCLHKPKSSRKEVKVIINKDNIQEANAPLSNPTYFNSTVNTNYRMNNYQRSKKELNNIQNSNRVIMNKTFTEQHNLSSFPKRNEIEDVNGPITHTKRKTTNPSNRRPIEENSNNISNNSFISVETPIMYPNTNNNSMNNTKRNQKEIVTLVRPKESTEYTVLNNQLDDLVSYINLLQQKDK